MSGWELVDWSPDRRPPIRLGRKLNKHRRRKWALMCNMTLRRIGTTYIHNGRKP